MNNLQIFNNPQFGKIRTARINGEPWLVGKDVAEALGYSDTAKAIRTHVDAEDKGVDEMATPGGRQELTIINESGLYSLILSSKLPKAKEFKHWVTSEVLPSIRKTGVYAAPTVDSAFLRQMADQMEEQERHIALLTAENETQRQALEDFKPQKQYLDFILSSNDTVATTQIAADYDLSAKKLNQILHDEGIQHNVNGQWILYRKHMGKGYTKSQTYNFTHSDGRADVRMTTRWTQKGRLLIHNALEKRGIIPVMDKE